MINIIIMYDLKLYVHTRCISYRLFPYTLYKKGVLKGRVHHW